MLHTIKKQTMKIYVKPSIVLFFFFAYFLEGVSQSAAKRVADQEILLQKALNSQNYSKATAYSYKIAHLYWEQKELNKATASLKECLGYCDKIKDYTSKHLAYKKLGFIYEE